MSVVTAFLTIDKYHRIWQCNPPYMCIEKMNGLKCDLFVWPAYVSRYMSNTLCMFKKYACIYARIQECQTPLRLDVWVCVPRTVCVSLHATSVCIVYPANLTMYTCTPHIPWYTYNSNIVIYIACTTSVRAHLSLSLSLSLSASTWRTCAYCTHHFWSRSSTGARCHGLGNEHMCMQASDPTAFQYPGWVYVHMFVWTYTCLCVALMVCMYVCMRAHVYNTCLVFACMVLPDPKT